LPLLVGSFWMVRGTQPLQKEKKLTTKCNSHSTWINIKNE
jgi:hypothetical protein